MGLLEAVPEPEILALADPDDTDGDGVSGRPNWVLDDETGTKALGRFGWKANQPSIRQQTAAAFLGDLGITSPIYPEVMCTTSQVECLSAPNGGEPELDERRLDRVTSYVALLAVPRRENTDTTEVLLGRALFRAVGCDQCHTPSFTTGEHRFEVLTDQVIWPYTDLLLHDMGPELADDRPEFDASGSEWRTPPLWGIGRLEEVTGQRRLLHDGRARSVAEAILWHGGEAQSHRDLFLTLSTEQRQALVRFVESL